MRGGTTLLRELSWTPARLDVNEMPNGKASSHATQMAAAFIHSWLKMLGVIMLRLLPMLQTFREESYAADENCQFEYA